MDERQPSNLSAKRTRLTELLDKILGDFDDFLRKASVDADLPALGLTDIASAVQYLHELGLTADASLLKVESAEIRNSWLDIVLADSDRTSSPDERAARRRRFGPYPQPGADEQEHRQLLQGLRLSVIGRVRLSADFLRSLRTSVSKQEANAPRGGSKSRGEWPKERVEREVKKYLQRKKADYDELVPACLDRHRESIKEFRSIFGPEAIACKINETCKVSEGGNKCTRQAVSRTDTYRYQIQPLLQNPPLRPHGWEPREGSDSEFDDELARMRREAGGG